MVKEKNRTRFWIAVIALLLAAILGVVIWSLVSRPETALPEATPRPEGQGILKEHPVQIIETEKEITGEIIQEGLRDMGKLVTEEYWFTEVLSYSSVKKYFRLELRFTESSFLASYDGVIEAGVDLTAAEIEKDDGSMTVLVRLPHAQIQSVSVDPDSLVVYSEREGIGNRITLEDYNSALTELESEAESRALEKGILERAERNAERIIRTFVGSLVDLSEYTMDFRWVD